MNDAQRARFDALVERAIAGLPAEARRVLDNAPLIVLDRPDARMMRDLGIDPSDATASDEICGLHTGTPFIDESIESPDLPSQIHLFRVGITNLAGGPEATDAALLEEIRITILHEIGHQFGLDEDDLADLGYD